ncbi:tellurite resistance TerB family protein [Photobacterium alginatilyticum]|uniref:Tellurite resistance TerB family protein n=1 Tax=Photobacterium alginatilyticum TaxID=1775171 RepID=A0ABW9YKF3_9GAMM|nr:tellurite resistance TerB family protein [Photobacterium alginatilyticum]NBI54309.1 tellurite resistance TerB family protein [Photobacterium alginatilyticum]
MKSLMDQLLNQASKYVDSSSKPSSGKTDLLKGAAAGGLMGAVLGNKKSRKLATKYGKKAAMLGGTAVVGTLAYQAYKKWQQGENVEWKPASNNEEGRPSESLSYNHTSIVDPQILIKAMVFAAKADGHIDSNEKQAIAQWLQQQNIAQDVEGLINRWINEPLDPQVIASEVSNLEQASEVYLVSLLAIDVDHFLEKAYLDQLASALSLPQELALRIQEQANL